MNPTVKKAILFAVGAASLTKEKFSDFVKELESEGALDTKEGEALVKDFLSESDKRARDFGAMVEKEVRRVMAEMNAKGETVMAKGEEVMNKEESHKCECGKDCDCKDMENCDCGEDCDCEDCKSEKKED